MKGFKDNIQKRTIDNTNFRKVVYTGKNLQLVLMSLEPGDEIGMEIHPHNDQFFRIERGVALCLIDGNELVLRAGDAVLIPAGAKHNLINTGVDAFKMYTIYGPPGHYKGTIHSTKRDSVEHEELFTGATSE